MIASVSAVAYAVWDGLFRYEAYGTIEGRVIRVASPCDGVVQSVHVRPGERVRQGQLLVTLENPDWEEGLGRVADELRITQATLDAELAKVSWNLRLEGDRRQKALAELYELWGTLAQEKSKLDDVQQKLRRVELLCRRGAAPDAEYETTRLAESGQRAKVEKLSLAVSQLQDRGELVGVQPAQGYGELKPILARIESLQNEMRRLRAGIERCELRSPVNGLVLESRFFAGEHADKSQTVIEILEDGSLEAVLYYPQEKASSLEVGGKLPLAVMPHQKVSSGIITRLESRLTAAPDPVRRYYRSDAALLAVHVKPQGDLDPNGDLRLGGIVKVPDLRWQLAAAAGHSEW